MVVYQHTRKLIYLPATLSPDEGDTLLSLLRDIAQAPSPTAENLPLDHNYHQHVDNLKKSNVWKKNHLVQEWLEGKWLSSPQVVWYIQSNGDACTCTCASVHVYCNIHMLYVYVGTRATDSH